MKNYKIIFLVRPKRATKKVNELSSIFSALKVFVQQGKSFFVCQKLKNKNAKKIFFVSLCGKNKFSNHEIISVKKFVSRKKMKLIFLSG
jgi:hypothetical protein